LRLRQKLLLAAVLLIPACQPRIGAKIAKTIADRSLMKRFPGARPENFIVTTTDAGSAWRVNYAAPPHSFGGYTAFLVDKRSGKIVRTEGTQ
jgi:hypothetical protein